MKRLALALSVAAIVVACKKEPQAQPAADTTAVAPAAAAAPADSMKADSMRAATDTAKAAQ